jgi:hypothetical protein
MEHQARPQWRKSTRSANDGNCVEVADLDTGVGVRDSKDTTGPVLVFAPARWRAFVDGTKAGEFDI